MTSRVPPMCYFCAHFRGLEPWNRWSCDAYPEQVPAEITDEYADHRLPFLGDNGIRFEAASADGAEYVADLYGPVELAEAASRSDDLASSTVRDGASRASRDR